MYLAFLTTGISLLLAVPAAYSLSKLRALLMSWNEFLYAVILLHSLRNYTVPLVIASYISEWGVKWGEMGRGRAYILAAHAGLHRLCAAVHGAGLHAPLRSKCFSPGLRGRQSILGGSAKAEP